MAAKKILLARPNSFIVTEMKKFISACNYTATPIADVSEFNNYNPSEIGGIVISTALNSSIKEEYAEVVKLASERFNGIPILLASLIDFDRVNASVNYNLGKSDLQYDLLSISTAAEKTFVNSKSDLIVIEKDDLVNADKYDTTLKTIRSYFK